MFMKNIMLILLALMITQLVACKSLSDAQEEAVDEDVQKMADDQEEAAVPSGVVGDDDAAAADIDESGMGLPSDDLLSKRVIYFDFDKSAIKPEFRDIIASHAKNLANNPNARVTLEGHADERGSREYNIALGERRAKAVQQMLLLQGASKDQLMTVSYGEERPVALGHSEDSWSMNRRAELVYTQE
jgi:peptidoglycan-associated lipoprotein